MRIALLALVLASFAPGKAQGEYAGDCYQQKDLDRSIRGCTLVLNNVTLTPKERSNAADWRCWAYYLKGDYDRALADCNKSVELNPRNAEALRDRCLIHAYKGQYDLAIADCDNALELRPEDAVALDDRCWTYYKKGDYDRALADCNKAIELKEDFGTAFADRCYVYNAKKQHDLAIRDCGKAIELKPTNAYAYWDRGYALQQKGDYAAALADLKKAAGLLSQSDAGEQSRLRDLIREVEAASAGTPQPETSATSVVAATGSAQTAPPEQQEPSLTRDERRAIQQRLQVLGFYASAIDGNFGAGTRKAIKAFQRENGLVATGNVDRPMIDLLARKAAAREQELAAQQGAASASSAPLTLESWTNAGLCTQALAPGKGGWDEDERFAGPVREAKRRGLSVDDCRVALGLPRQSQQATAGSAGSATESAQPVPPEQQEPSLGSDERRAIQQQLQVLGFYGSAIDGNLGAGTRKAIKAFQRENGLVATGYVDRPMIDLLARKAGAREQELAAQQAAANAANASSATPTYESWTTAGLCGQALAPDKSGWDQGERFAATVREAQRRGLSVDDCRVALGLSRQPQQPAAPAAPTAPPPNDFTPVIATLQPIDDVFVAVRPAKVRVAPNVVARVTETLAIGDRIEVLGRLPAQDWYLVARDGSPLGYVVMNQLASEVDYAKAQAPAEASTGASAPKNQPIALPPELAALDYGRYHALVIGNSGYRLLPKLGTAVDDAKAVATLLERDYGFDVSLVVDGTEKSIIAEISRLRRTLTPGDNLLIYYAGHGWYDEGAERGYWLPVDAAEDDQSHWISNADITDALKAMRAKQVLVVADSCYSGSITRGLAIRSGNALYIADIVGKRARTALTSGGLEPVLDSGGGGHSVFAKAFLAALQANDGIIDGEGLYHQVYEEVRLNAEQEPGYGNIRLAGHDGGDFLFVRKR
jgi:peptidoglycan hydrolase-like protein with peptidoglycan-binding domain/regulator of sirC expression with transglutaminase-like and TPR domain